MGIWPWVAENWFNLLSSVLMAGGLWFTGYSLHEEAKARRVGNLFAAIGNHRELWSDFYRQPNLARVLDASADLTRHPATREEEGFVKLVIQHLNGVYQAMQNGLVIKPEGIRRDVYSFFSLPIPSAVWDKVKALQNEDFVSFVEMCRNWK